MNILVTGSNGQVGKAMRRIADTLPYDFLFTEKSTLDISNQVEVEQAILGFKPKIIINCAAYTAVDRAEEEQEKCFEINAYALDYIARSAQQLETPAFIIHLSSDYVYHPEHEDMISEDEVCHPKGVYALSKRDGEERLLAASRSCMIIRTSWVYDEKGHNFVNTMDRLGGQKESLNVVNDQIGSPTYARDIAAFIAHILQRFDQENRVSWTPRIFNYSNEGFTNWAEFAQEIMHKLGHNCEILPIPTAAYPTPAKRPLNSRMDKSLVKTTFDVEIRHWKEALEACLQHKKTAK